MRPTRWPIKLPKMTKYSAEVTAEGTMVCAQMRVMRLYSRITMVLKPTQRASFSALAESAVRVCAATSFMMNGPRQRRHAVALGDEATVDDRNIAAQGFRFFEIVSGEDDRGAARVYLSQEFP